ncbi:MAG: type II secretion system protein [Planctomycetota bacterium]
MTRRRAAGFTIIELLVVILIITTLTAILLPALSGAREQARLVQELAAVRTVMKAYTMYADDNDAVVAPGYLPTDVRDQQGNDAINTRPINLRYPWKLAPYLSFQFAGSLLVAEQRERYEQGSLDAYDISNAPSFGLNSYYLGGHEGGEGRPFVATLEGANKPSTLLTFAASRFRVGFYPGSEVSDGYHEVKPPKESALDPTATRFDPEALAPDHFGHLNPRTLDLVVAVMFDGHAEALAQSDMLDMRRWSNAAAIADDPDWTFIPPS